MATTKFQAGDLVFFYGSPRYYQFKAGIAEEVPEAGSTGDELHANIRFLDGVLEWRDVSRYGSAGKPFSRKGRVVVKWLSAKGQGGRTLDDFSRRIGQHEEWDAEMFTESGWALVRDPWGDQHWLPPRSKKGADTVYVFNRGTVGKGGQLYNVTMQQTLLPPKP